MATKMEAVLHYPSTNRETTIQWKGSPDGIFSTKEQKVQLHAGMSSYNAKKKKFVAHIDAEKWLQIKADVQGWVGPDPRLEMAARVREIRRQLQTRGIDWSKYAWPLIFLVLGCMAALVAMAAFAMSKQ